MTKWERKGAQAKESGRYGGMEEAWYAAKGKPKLSKRDKQLGVTFSGKMVDAQQDFYRGYHYRRVVHSNPLPVNKWETVQVRRLSNGRIQLRGRK